jgi:putative addiction module component (TIGR02574 family)
MTPATPEQDHVRDIVAEAMKLPPDVRESVALELLDSIEESPEDPEAVKKAWQEELERRMKSVRDGTVRTYSVEETMAYLRQTIAERDGR